MGTEGGRTERSRAFELLRPLLGSAISGADSSAVGPICSSVCLSSASERQTEVIRVSACAKKG